MDPDDADHDRAPRRPRNRRSDIGRGGTARGQHLSGGDERTRTADPLLAKHAPRNAVTCGFARIRRHGAEPREAEGVG